MSVEIKVPAVGESITEGVLARWLKKNGEMVRRGDPLFTLDSDKATQDVSSPADGVLSIDVPEGTTVKIGGVVGRITAGAGAPAPAPKPETAPPPAAKSSAPARS